MKEETLVLSSRGRERFTSYNINCPVTWRHLSWSNQCDGLKTLRPIGMRRWEMPAAESFAKSSLPIYITPYVGPMCTREDVATDFLVFVKGVKSA